MTLRLFTPTERLNRFGVPNAEGTYLTVINLPFPLVLAWDKAKTTSRIRCHKEAAPRLEAAFEDILKTYGLKAIEKLGINLYGGCFNYRPMRGGNQWSAHAWGLAVDMNPEANGLRTPWRQALFSKAEYEPMVKAYEAVGFASLGKIKNYDAMHFELAANAPAL